MSTIFTKIANGDIPSYKVAESEDFYAFLDIAPMAKGHTLVIPKKVEEDYIFNLDENTYMELCAFARKVAQESMVLLKNEGSLLPLDSGEKIALIGPFVSSSRSMLGSWTAFRDYDSTAVIKEKAKKDLQGYCDDF